MGSRLFIGLLGLLLLHGVLTANASTLYYDFFLQEANFTRLCSTKTMLTMNGTFPGPTITARKGDTVFVNVHNEGTYGVTIHWHGVTQPRNPWSDGPENITQCPIQPGNNFTYEIPLTIEEGTLWWHAHNDWSRATVHGALIILPDENSTFPFPNPSKEQTVILASWYNGDPRDMMVQGLAKGSDPGVSDAYTINGQPGDLYNCSAETMYTMDVEFGETYLLRVINAVLNEEMFFAIAGHDLTVVAQDASYVKPITTPYIMITPGQTMDILVTANQTAGYYYMAASPFSDSFLAPFDNSTTSALFLYNGTFPRPDPIPFPVLPNATDDDAAANFTGQLRFIANESYPINVPKVIDRRIQIAVSINLMPCTAATCASFTRLTASLNNVSYVSQPTSILEAYYKNMSGVYDTDFPTEPVDMFNFTGDAGNVSPFTNFGTKVRMLEYGEAVEIVFQGTSLLSAGNHPLHIHGYSFYLVGRGLGNFNSVTDPDNYNLVDPPYINTFGVPKNGWIALRFIADNPGVWFIHCHYDKHAAWGMDTVLIVKDGGNQTTSMRPPPPNMPACL